MPMLPIRTEKTTDTLAGPSGQPSVQDLPIDRTTVESGPLEGAVVLYSVWEPSEEERKLISEGAYVLLGIYAPGHPVVSVGVTTERKVEGGE